MDKFCYTIEILTNFTFDEWELIFREAVEQHKRESQMGEWLYNCWNLTKYDESFIIYLAFNKIDRIAKLFEYHNDTTIYAKCSNMLKELNKEFERITE